MLASVACLACPTQAGEHLNNTFVWPPPPLPSWPTTIDSLNFGFISAQTGVDRSSIPYWLPGGKIPVSCLVFDCADRDTRRVGAMGTVASTLEHCASVMPVGDVITLFRVLNSYLETHNPTDAVYLGTVSKVWLMYTKSGRRNASR